MGPLVDRWRRACVVLGLALAVAATATATPAQAQAQHRARHRHHGARTHRVHDRAAGSSNAAGSAAKARTVNSSQSPTPTTALCAQGSPEQAFLGQGDFNYYASVPGPAGTGFDGSTWSLSGGATTAGGVVDMPAGSQAVSPDICITTGDPEARTLVRSVKGGDNVQVSVSYYTSAGWSQSQPAGGVNGQGTNWSLSNTINLPHPPPSPPAAGPESSPGSVSGGWEIVRFTFTPGGGHSDFQLTHLGIAVPPPTPSTGPCSSPILSQTFLPAGDTNYYTPAPGQSGGGFLGTGWTLTSGAKIVTATRADGSSGLVLDLPAGSMAVSPNMCVTALYPTARMMIRSLFGGDDLSFRVSYGGTDTWTNPHETGHIHGNNSDWSLSDSVQLKPGNGSGWQVLRVTLVPNGGHSEFQLYDLELDPYAKGG